MRKPLATVSVRFVNNFLEGTGIDVPTRERLVRSAGIAPALLQTPGTRITREQFAALYRVLVAHLDDEMPGVFSRPLRRGATELLCLGVLDASSLQQALQRYARFHRVIVDDFSLELERGPQNTRLAIVPIPGRPAPSILAQQLVVKFAHGLAAWLIGRTLPIVRIEFAFAPPVDFSDHPYLQPGPVYFGRPASALLLPSALMDAPLVHRSRDDLRHFIDGAPAGWILTDVAEPTVGHRVREYLETHAHGPCDLESVALELHYSVRTLCRRLEAEGTSFRLLKDQVRRDVAIEQLATTTRPIADIAFALGFEDTTAFYRAFKHWTGTTPGAYRRNASEADAMRPPGRNSAIGEDEKLRI